MCHTKLHLVHTSYANEIIIRLINVLFLHMLEYLLSQHPWYREQ